MPALTDAQRDQFVTEGYVFPVPVLTPAEVAKYLAHYQEFREWTKDKLASVPPKDRFKFVHETHLVLPWIHELVSHPAIVSALQSLLGPDIVCWNTVWFAKDPKDAAFVSWHQDGTYWNFKPTVGITAWIALTPSNPPNGCVRVIPRTQGAMMAYRETFADDNLLSRGQEIENIDASKAVDLILQPGQMSLHDFWMVHGSNANNSGEPRIGLAVRYTRPDVQGPRFLVS
ncbi:MAG TPA: phytanoyl-CoA dioxygenase family protein, partial [Kofleriaceae bacterium]